MKRILCLSAALALSACGMNAGGLASTGAAVADTAGILKPTPLVNTAIDEKALNTAASGVDIAAISFSALARAGIITKGSPTAHQIARGLDEARAGVNAAALARQALDAKSYSEALDKAEAALATVKAALRPYGV